MEALGALLALAWAHPLLALVIALALVLGVLGTAAALCEKVEERRFWQDPRNWDWSGGRGSQYHPGKPVR